MEIVIKIDDKEYEQIKHDAYHSFDKYVAYTVAYRAIKNGTPLPKHHGRLIDADALYDSAKLCHTEEDGTSCVEWREINDAETIIEADKESENDT